MLRPGADQADRVLASVSHRITVSDLDDPVRQLHRYALPGLVVMAVFTLVVTCGPRGTDRHLAALLQPGTALAGEPAGAMWSLAARLVG